MRVVSSSTVLVLASLCPVDALQSSAAVRAALETAGARPSRTTALQMRTPAVVARVVLGGAGGVAATMVGPHIAVGAAATGASAAILRAFLKAQHADATNPDLAMHHDHMHLDTDMAPLSTADELEPELVWEDEALSSHWL